MKLSHRLQHIDSMVGTHYDHVWDCCCDHGFLGAALLERQAAPFIHFVDIVPELMSLVKGRLQRFFPNSQSQWQTHCLDINTLPLAEYSGKQLIIIAGVGGDLMVQFIQALQQQFSHLDVDYLLCPVYQQFQLRQSLIHFKMGLIQEKLIEDNGRFYEILHISQQTPNQQDKIVHPVGSEQLWLSTHSNTLDLSQRYLDKVITHYTHMMRRDPTQAKKPLQLYTKTKRNLQTIKS